VPADGEFVEVTDPTHPLFVRKFRLLEVSRSACGTVQVTVRYRDDLTLRLPQHATSLSGLAGIAIRSKLTAAAVRDLLAFVKENESCLRPSRKSGNISRRSCDKKSAKKSTASFRR
jgi:hypothetical protein